MSRMHKVEGEVEVNCSAAKIFDMLRAKAEDIPKLCSDKIPNVKEHKPDDSLDVVGSTRKWDLILGGKSTYIVDRIEAIDMENRVITRVLIDGDMMKYHYKSFKNDVQPIDSSNNSCIVKCSMEYEKIDEDYSPEPSEFLDFALAVFKDMGRHLSN